MSKSNSSSLRSQSSSFDSQRTVPLEMEILNQERNERQTFSEEVLNGAEIENVNLEDRRFIEFRISQSQDSQRYLRNHGEGADISQVRYSTLHQAISLECDFEVIEFILQNGGEVYVPQNSTDVSTESFARHVGVSEEIMNLLKNQNLERNPTLQTQSEILTQISQDILATPPAVNSRKRKREDEQNQPVRRQDSQETYFEEEIMTRSRSLRTSLSKISNLTDSQESSQRQDLSAEQEEKKQEEEQQEFKEDIRPKKRVRISTVETLFSSNSRKNSQESGEGNSR